MPGFVTIHSRIYMEEPDQIQPVDRKSKTERNYKEAGHKGYNQDVIIQLENKQLQIKEGNNLNISIANKIFSFFHKNGILSGLANFIVLEYDAYKI